MKSKVEVYVEVTDEIRNTRNGSRQQVCYVDTGGRYPEESTLFVSDAGALKAGRYVADGLRKKGYAFQLDMFSLKPVAAVSAAKG